MKKYQSGTFCRDIACPRHKALESYEGDVYLTEKAVHCKDCYAWMFLNWLKDRNWRIVLTAPEMSSKELVARIKGVDPVRVEDLTDDEILCL
jgi:hypothetical protein